MTTKDPDFSSDLERINAMSDDEIDYSDIPAVTDFSGFVRGKFYRPEKHPVTIRLDQDVVAWFKDQEPKYQTAINRVLRDYMVRHAKSA
jgi:uncharacterized protein (DUF4415 family)